MGRAPPRMEFVQLEGLRQGGSRRGRRRTRRARPPPGGAEFAEALAESPNGSGRESKFRSDGSRKAALLPTRQDLPPQVKRKRGRHRSHSLIDPVERHTGKHSKVALTAAKLGVGSCGQTCWRVTDVPSLALRACGAILLAGLVTRRMSSRPAASR